MAYLIVKQGEDDGKTFDLTESQSTIGRSNKCTVQLRDVSVSRTHATIHCRKDGSYYIDDNGSTYGTIVNKQKISRAELPDNAVIQLGAAILEFHFGSVDKDCTTRELMKDDAGEKERESFTILRIMSQDDTRKKSAELQRGEGTKLEMTETIRSLERHLQTAYEISSVISSTYDLNELYRKILNSIFATIKVERGNILLIDEEKNLQVQASLDKSGRKREVPFSRTIVNKVIQSGVSLLLRNAQAEADFDSSNSIFMHNIRSAMCVPLQTHEKIIGVINVDASGASFFTEEDLQLLTLIGNQAGIVIDNARLIEQNIKAERLAAVGQAVASLAHCIKNILQGLKGGASLVDEGMKMQNQDIVTTGWDLVKSSQQRISQLVLNMLDYSKEREPAYQKANLFDHMKNIHDLMKDRAKDKEVEVAFDFQETTPEVECDPMGIYRATLNLLTNAIDAVESETGKVRLDIGPSQKSGFVDIKVIDNGSGIPLEVQDKLFEVFHSTKDSKGTGLGLAVSRKIVREHKGDILVDTEAGKGTTFTIQLPIRRPS